MRLKIKLAVMGVLWSAAACASEPERPPDRGLSPSEALKTFEIRPGFRIELFASEPLIQDPVAMEIDESGRIYVAEMPGYPLKPRGSGRIKLLSDDNGDGRPDRSTVFAADLNLPTGLMKWKAGLLVTDVPDVLYLEDTNEDGVADVRRSLLTGFARSNPQHILNNPIYGLDNWIYVAHEPAIPALIFKDLFGDRGAPVRFSDRPGAPQLPQNAGGRNIRFRPDSGQLEALSSASQFGHTFDEWGRYFTVTNGNHARQEVMAARYLERNPHLLAATAVADISDHGNASRVFPITENPENALLTDVGQFTSACGLTRYLGGAFPESLQRLAFVAEPVHNLVHADVWSESGAVVTASRLDPDREFLASTDGWFRPVNFYVGPDGALYVVDYYRRSIEHPEWMSDEHHDPAAPQDVLYQGTDAGRIYRVTADESPASGPGLEGDLTAASDLDLVHHLESPNLWWRRTAQRLLVDRSAGAAVQALQRMAEEGRSATARLHALWTLEGLNSLKAETISRALQDPVPGVRENAIVLAESRLPESPELLAQLLQMGGDTDERVRFQLLCTLGSVPSPEAERVRTRLWLENIESRWMQLAALTAAGVDSLQLLRAAADRFGEAETAGRLEFFENAAALLGAGGGPAETAGLLRLVSRAPASGNGWWQAGALRGLARGIRGSRRSAGEAGLDAEMLLDIAGRGPANLRSAGLDLLEMTGLPKRASADRAVRQAAAILEDRNADPARRADSVRLLALAGQEESRFLGLLVESEPEEVQSAALRALGRNLSPAAGDFLLNRLSGMTPRLRTETVAVLLRKAELAGRLLDLFEAGTLPVWTITTMQRMRLVMYPDPDVRRRVQALIRNHEQARLQVLEDYEPALRLSGNIQQGEQVFSRSCSPCHQMEGRGGELGPDLATVRNRSARSLLQDILLPSRSIAQNYEVYVVFLKDGGQLDGVIAEQTPTSLALRQAEGAGSSIQVKQVVVARESIDRLRASSVSAMPENLESGISPQEMADLIAFIRER